MVVLSGNPPPDLVRLASVKPPLFFTRKVATVPLPPLVTNSRCLSGLSLTDPFESLNGQMTGPGGEQSGDFAPFPLVAADPARTSEPSGYRLKMITRLLFRLLVCVYTCPTTFGFLAASATDGTSKAAAANASPTSRRLLAASLPIWPSIKLCAPGLRPVIRVQATGLSRCVKLGFD